MSTVETKDETYNGWANYPTWAVNLWLENDEALYRETLERVSNAVAGSFTQYEWETPEQVARSAVADMLKDWVRDDLTPDLGATFAADLLGYALDCVDWFEIADAWTGQVTG
jgi:hypothetical protein